MKLIPTGLDLTDVGYSNFIKLCNTQQTEFPYTAPLNNFGQLQFYVDFGLNKPLGSVITAVSLCSDGTSEQIMTANYVVSKNPDGNWYGVWKFFNEPETEFKTFVVHVSFILQQPDFSIITNSWYSQALEIETCDPLVKIKACMPELATELGFDINDIYYGLPDVFNYMGIDSLRYFHIAYVRTARVRETTNQITFKQSLTRSFSSVVDRNYVLETEIVPQWYKDILLAIYSRGIIEVDGKQWLIKDLLFEALNDEDLMWMPYANLYKTNKLFFGCDESSCQECCSPLVTGVSVEVVEGPECCSPEVTESTVEVVVGPAPAACPYHIVTVIEDLGINATFCHDLKYSVRLEDDNGNPVNNSGPDIYVACSANYEGGDCASPISYRFTSADLIILTGDSVSYNYFAATNPNERVVLFTAYTATPNTVDGCDIEIG